MGRSSFCTATAVARNQISPSQNCWPSTATIPSPTTPGVTGRAVANTALSGTTSIWTVPASWTRPSGGSGRLVRSRCKGSSLGGAVALQTLAADHRFRCGISESTFATLRDVVQSDARGVLHFSWDAPVDTALRRAGEIAHFPAESISPERAAAGDRMPRADHPRHQADSRIPLHDGERIFHSLKSPGCEWYAVPGAGPRRGVEQKSGRVRTPRAQFSGAL